MFEKETIREIVAAAEKTGVEPAALLAVAEVECGGRTTARVNGRDEPLIRFEGHYFDRRLAGTKQADARRQGLASPKAGGVKNPVAQTGRWQLLARAMRIDRNAALESVSWGLGQVMGAHWQWLGYADVEALVAEARGSVAGQIRLMLRFIEKSSLVEVLNRHDWAGFARRYNGPLYSKYAYDRKMAAAWKTYCDRLLRDGGIAGGAVDKTTAQG
ncbi:peptidoglycan-binding protein [Paramesorhizobium deserti]|uniref:Peptidoglycan-binding protein n=1 Tax=Paramesorhizobium deserti TaxID=1494590 RepID=A0A135HS93_9HYPH|nr:N-acetylmuramidase family protein [Paramesorhizobium deserti]KXF76065.1 peptidoglycan-binding protein [Paramesorhizobium deserti]